MKIPEEAFLVSFHDEHGCYLGDVSAQEIRALLARANRAWINVDERIPKTKDDMLCMTATGRKFVAFYSDGWWTDRSTNSGVKSVAWWSEIPTLHKEPVEALLSPGKWSGADPDAAIDAARKGEEGNDPL